MTHFSRSRSFTSDIKFHSILYFLSNQCDLWHKLLGSDPIGYRSNCGMSQYKMWFEILSECVRKSRENHFQPIKAQSNLQMSITLLFNSYQMFLFEFQVIDENFHFLDVKHVEKINLEHEFCSLHYNCR